MVTSMLAAGAVHGSVRIWLRLEGVMVLLLTAYLYARGGHSWLTFAVLFLAPDLSFAGYAAGPRAGAALYNVAHSYAGPAALAVIAVASGTSTAWALIWAAHVGFDRAAGYGLKYPSAFGDTHLGRIGRSAAAQPQ